VAAHGVEISNWSLCNKTLFCTDTDYRPLGHDTIFQKKKITCPIFSGISRNYNTIEEEIKERLIAGNKAYYANQKMFQSKLLSRKSKLKLYWTLIRPVAVHACETWVLKENSIQKLMIFERKILRKMFGPTKGPNGLWRIKTNEEMDELIQRKT
jgi:hypothetical protein